MNINCGICSNDINIEYNNTCFYCTSLCCSNCIQFSEWDEQTCVECLRYLPLKSQFDDMVKNGEIKNSLLEKHKFLNHNNPNIMLKSKDVTLDPLVPRIMFDCNCGVSETKGFKLHMGELTLNPFNFSEESLIEQEVVDLFNDKIFIRNKPKGNKNIFFLHYQKCGEKMENKILVKWLNIEGKYRYELNLFQIWSCETCKLEFVNMFKESLNSFTYN
ncbi:hypothetical protein [Spiroplasma endosymbiont of Aspidapion aeneum]|uniref:hypothetical protein n=1 Tax=Spiroplasma endosymbiont of Aspidapion aeneum TaxID=3066276 RepID=UPI00313DD669